MDFFQVASCHLGRVSSEKTCRESLGGLWSPLESFGVEGAAPSCRDLETELDQRRVGEDPVCHSSCHC